MILPFAGAGAEIKGDDVRTTYSWLVPAKTKCDLEFKPPGAASWQKDGEINNFGNSPGIRSVTIGQTGESFGNFPRLNTVGTV